jgi:thioredoxin reductase (NADPH)
VVLAVGSTYRRLGVPGEEDFIGAGVHFCATCDGPFYKGKEMLVVGGGNSGFQEALFLSKFASQLSILEVAKEVRASKALQQKVSETKSIRVYTQTAVQELKGNGRLSSVVVKDLAANRTRTLTPAAVFVFIGVQPNTAFLRGTVDLDQYGFIVTHPNLETSLDGVFAAGDCRQGSTKQIASSVGEGATAALMVREHLERSSEIKRPSPEG